MFKKPNVIRAKSVSMRGMKGNNGLSKSVSMKPKTQRIFMNKKSKKQKEKLLSDIKEEKNSRIASAKKIGIQKNEAKEQMKENETSIEKIKNNISSNFYNLEVRNVSLNYKIKKLSFEALIMPNKIHIIKSEKNTKESRCVVQSEQSDVKEHIQNQKEKQAEKEKPLISTIKLEGNKENNINFNNTPSNSNPREKSEDKCISLKIKEPRFKGDNFVVEMDELDIKLRELQINNEEILQQLEKKFDNLEENMRPKKSILKNSRSRGGSIKRTKSINKKVSFNEKKNTRKLVPKYIEFVPHTYKRVMNPIHQKMYDKMEQEKNNKIIITMKNSVLLKTNGFK